MNTIYIVERFVYHGRTSEGVIIEDVEPIGYFTGKKQVAKALAQCKRDGISRNNLRVLRYPLSFGNNQKEVYVLLYEYCTSPIDGISEYYYIFPPCKSEADCLRLRDTLLRNPEFSPSDEKEYYESEDGFRIQSYEINAYYPPEV